MNAVVGGVDDLSRLHDAGAPDAVARFRQKLAAADALLIVTPEYNYSVPGVLKNAIDWASRPPNPPLDDKPLAIMGASPGMLGTARCQYHLRQIAVFLNMHVVNRPEVFVSKCAEKIKDGQLTDEPTRKIVGELLIALRDFTTRLARGRIAVPHAPGAPAFIVCTPRTTIPDGIATAVR